MILHLDFETACDLDIRQVGLSKYVSHSSFRISLTALAPRDGGVEQWEGLPAFMLDWSRNPPDEVHAFNAPFERAALARYGVRFPVEHWRDTMAHAYCRGFSGGLDKVGEQVGIPADQRKLKTGSRLISKFCKPRRPSKANPDRYWTAATAPSDWERFKLYNRMDVIAEREIARRLEPYPMTEEELELMWWDWGVNDRGLPVDLTLVENAIKVADRKAQEMKAECQQLTGGISPGQVSALLKWCRERDYDGETLQSAEIQKWIET
jgi:DNA polymerase